MKKALLLLTIIVIASVSAFAGDNFANGPHYNLNIIGFQKCGNWQDGDDCFNGNAGDIPTHGHTIFVPLKTEWVEDPCLTTGDSGYADPTNVQVAELKKGVRVLVADGEDMQVIDRDATDGLARFVIPDGEYIVVARALGKPGGCMDIDTIICLDEYGNQVECNPILSNYQYTVVGHIDVDRTGKKPHWDNVTDELLYAVNGDDYFEYFWQIYNKNLRLLQLRFYPLPD